MAQRRIFAYARYYLPPDCILGRLFQSRYLVVDILRSLKPFSFKQDCYITILEVLDWLPSIILSDILVPLVSSGSGYGTLSVTPPPGSGLNRHLSRDPRSYQ